MAAIASALPSHVATAATSPSVAASANATSSSGSTSASGSSTSAGSLAASDSLANEQTFLQLLVAQLQNQDPTDPMDGTQFVTQLAQFAQLEQDLAMRQDLDKIAGAVTTTTATSSTGSGGGATGTDSTGATGTDSTGTDSSGNKVTQTVQ